MLKDHFDKINSNPNIINNFDLLKKIGVWDQIQNLNNEINNLEELLSEAVELFNKRSIIELVNYITTKMLDKFIPSYLAFVIQEDVNPDKANIICFKNMKLIKNILSIDSIKPFRKFFSLSPVPVTFEAFKHMIEDKSLTDILIPVSPEIIVPMMGLDGMYGFIVFGEKILEKKYSEQEINYIDRIMKFASISLQNNIHYRMAILDSKTSLYTHSFFMRKLDEEINRVKRYNSELSILMIDIDNFKSFNDKYGHLIGDRVLYDIAKILYENVRREDIAARFGGEEFVILLIECNKDGALPVAERIRKLIADLRLDYLEDGAGISVSIGVSYATKKNITDSNELINQADQALYNSKKTGKNKTTLFSENLIS